MQEVSKKSGCALGGEGSGITEIIKKLKKYRKMKHVWKLKK